MRSPRTVSLIALIVASVAQADFTRLVVEPFVDEQWLSEGYERFDVDTYRLYAEFDGTGDDGVLAVFGIEGVPLGAASNDGVFDNTPFGGMTAPFFKMFWFVLWDTYVTITSTTNKTDDTTITPFLAEDTDNLETNWTIEDGAWFVTPDDDESFPTDDRVLLAQFTVQSDRSVSGTAGVLLRDGTAIRQPFGCRADLDENGHVGFGDVLTILREWGPCGYRCLEDITMDDYVGFDDLLVVLAAWGPCDIEPTPVPLECQCCDGPCPADIDGSGVVDYADVLEVLDSWHCGDECPSDLNCNGRADTEDLLLVLVDWGPCPG